MEGELDPQVEEFLLNTRKLQAIPNIQEKENVVTNGWDFANEVQELAIILAGSNLADVAQRGYNETAIDDYAKAIRQVADKDVAKDILYYSFSYNEIQNALKDKDLDFVIPADVISAFSQIKNWNERLSFLMGILDALKIKPFNPTDQLHQRRKVMWSV
jgi:hypothetical protein